MQNSLLNLKIEKDLDKQALWRVRLDPGYALKKEGDVVGLSDGLYLENLKMRTVVSPRLSPEYALSYEWPSERFPVLA